MSEGGILTGKAICAEVEGGGIVIDPWEPSQLSEDVFEWPKHGLVNSASYDLRLGNKVAVYKNVTYFIQGRVAFLNGNTRDPVHGELLDLTRIGDGSMINVDPGGELDSKKKQEVYEFTMDPNRGWLCKPGIGYLMHTAERILTNRYVPVLDGKSSVGRLFTTAHVTAGYGDAGFDGQYTLEVTVTHPTRIYPGMRFCQVRFHTQVGEAMDYQKKGHYVGKSSMGPVASMTYKQFEEDVR